MVADHLVDGSFDLLSHVIHWDEEELKNFTLYLVNAALIPSVSAFFRR